MRLSTRNLLCVLAFLLFTFVVSAQILEPLSGVPQEQRDALYKRLDGYVEAYKHRKWDKLYGFISTVGRGGVDVQTFVVAMSSNHGEDFAQYPDLQTFTPSRTRKNGDGYDIVGCAGAVREGEPFRGIAEVHAVFEHENWFFTGWTFRDSSEESCKQLSDPNWQPDRPLDWNRLMQELARGTKCDPLPTLQISDVHTTFIGNTLRKDRVIDGTASKDWEPLPFAEVRLNSGKKLVQRTTTDAQGHFLLENLPLGRYTLSFEGMGSFSIEVTPPRFSQQCFYNFSSLHGCLSWGENSD